MTVAAASSRPEWEIFCQVVDNFGDIGVCWRLARDLAAREPGGVRLWVDDWAVLQQICPPAADVDPRAGSVVEGVEVRGWEESFSPLAPGRIVVEAFACELPASQLEVMAAQSSPPVWVNLEYLSAEAWVVGCHGMASPHPRLPLVKYFFFPGFDPRVGGLLREPSLLQRRDAFVKDPAGRLAWLRERRVDPDPQTLRVSLFAYEQPGLGELISCWTTGARRISLLVPVSRVLADVADGLGCPTPEAGAHIRRGSLDVHVLPFTDQDGYDRLLWASDLNFVRGEDSFVRAQWAARPFVWQIYPQADAVHHEKLDAFLALHRPGLSAATADAHAAFWRAWNACPREGIRPARAWPAFAEALPVLAEHARNWCVAQAALPDLADNLTKFCSHIRQSPR